MTQYRTWVGRALMSSEGFSRDGSWEELVLMNDTRLVYSFGFVFQCAFNFSNCLAASPTAR